MSESWLQGQARRSSEYSRALENQGRYQEAILSTIARYGQCTVKGRILAIVFPEPPELQVILGARPVRGTTEQLAAFCREHDLEVRVTVGAAEDYVFRPLAHNEVSGR